MASLKLRQLVLELFRTERVCGKIVSKSFSYVINYLSENYHEKIRMKNLAQQMNISYDYFQHHFKEIAGESPRQFLMRKRLEAAARLLEGQSLNCTEIASRCGFSNSAQFSAVFKREMGMAPRDYRKARAEFYSGFASFLNRSANSASLYMSDT